MTKEKDFLGKDITEVIEQACREFDASQDELEIEILETGSAGIFGLCKKQAHIRVRKKKPAAEVVVEEKEVQEKALPEESVEEAELKTAEKAGAEPEAEPKEEKVRAAEGRRKAPGPPQAKERVHHKEKTNGAQELPVEPPSQESLDTINSTITELLGNMGYPSQVEITLEGNAINCVISSEFEEQIIGSEGRTLDSLQYLLRKMLLQSLNDKYMLTLDAGNFRERRAEELKKRALELAAQVKEDGKTQAIPALNPSERRIVHMVLQEDKGIRSRSVGDGLFKKVLVYKPGKGRRSGGRKKRG